MIRLYTSPSLFVFKLLWLSLFFSACTSSPLNDKTAEESLPQDSSLEIKTEAQFAIAADSLIAVVFDSLSHVLMSKIASEGTPSAVSYCNVHALPIVAHFSNQGFTIARRSNKPRNPANALTRESAVKAFNFFESLPANERRSKHLLASTNDEFIYYKPIVLMPHCLVCHGSPSQDIDPQTLAKIDALYPNDLARNYMPNDLRGVWEVMYPRKAK
jgi:hypothetical protein